MPPSLAGLTMPPEWAPHERTLMGWPCRRELWRDQLTQAKVEYAGVANAVAAFEPVTMVVASAADGREARAALTDTITIVELPLNDSWLRDHGPVYVVDDVTAPTRRTAVAFGFNAWGQRFTPYNDDAALPTRLARRLGDDVAPAPLVLEGGSIAVDGTGTLLTTEQCLLDPNRNPGLSRTEIEQQLRDHLGVTDIVWLGRGLVEDRDTDGHVDLIAAFVAPGRVLLQTAPPGSPNHEAMADNRRRASGAGLDIIDFAPLAHGTVAGEPVGMSYLNFYLGDRFAIVPTAGQPEPDAEALTAISAALPHHDVVGVPGLTLAYGGGGPHCITQQVPKIVT
jgi:agmatine deiminase